MSSPNPLVATAPAEPSGFFNAGTGDNGWATGFSIADSAADAYKGISEGNWIEGGLGVLGLAADAASMAIDPFGTLLSSAASFLMEHMQPLKEALDWLAGDPPVIESYSTTWKNVSQELGKIAGDYQAAVDGTSEWTGAAADAYRKAAGEQLDALSGAASTAGSVGTVVGVMGMVVGFVREMVRDLIADLVAKLITWVLEAVFTLGFGTPVIVAQAVTAISKWATRIGELIQKLISTIKKVSPLLGRLVEIFTKIMKVVGKLVGKVTGLDVISTKSIKPGGLFHRTDAPDLSPSGGRGTPSSPDPSSSTPDSSPSSPSSPDTSPSSPSTPSSPAPDGPARTPDSSSPSSASPPSAPSPWRTPDSPPAPDAPSRTPDSASAPSAPSASRTPDGSPSSPAGPGGPSSPSAPSTPDAPAPARNTGQTVQSSVAPPEAPPRLDTPPPGRTPDGSPSSTPSQAAPMGGGAPTAGGNTPSSPSAGRAPTGGQGWTGTPGGRGDLVSSAPPPRTPDTSTSAARADAPARPSTPTSPSSPSTPPSPSHAGGMPPAGAPSGGMPHAPSAGTPHSPSAGAPAAGRPDATPPSRATTPSAAAPHAPTTPHTPSAGAPHAPSAGTPHAPRTDTPPMRPQPSGPTHPNAPHSPNAPHGGPSRPDAPHRPDSPSRPDGTGPAHRPDGSRPPSPDGPRHRGTDTTEAPHRTPDTEAPHRGQDADRPHDPTPDRPHDSAPDNHDPDAPPADRPSPDEAHQRHAETTPSGVSHHGGDRDMGDLPHRVPNDPRYFTADVHVTPDGRARVGGHTYTPAEYADMLRRSGYDGSRPVRLIGCDAGSNDFARQLSKHLDAPVLAPTKPAWTDTHGRVFTSDATIRPDGTREPKIPPNGEWETHHPDGTKTKTGDDGYAPDTERHDPDATHDTDGAVDRAGDPPYPRDPEFAHHPDDLPPNRAEPQVLETLDRGRCDFDENGLITHYNGQPVDSYLNRVLEDRAKLIENKIADGTIKPPNHPAENIPKYASNNVVCTSVSIDRQTGRIYESVNGSRNDLIPEDKLHPALAARRDAMMGNPPPAGDGNGYTQPDRHPDRTGQPLLKPDGSEFRTPYPINDMPTRHAEVKNVNQMLIDRGVPADVSPEELRRILGEMRVDNAFTPSKSDRFPDPARCCANCTRMIDGVPSTPGKLTHPPGDPRLQELPE